MSELIVPSPDAPKCGLCLYFKASPRDLKMGQCTRFPPSASPLPAPNGGLVTWSDFPVVQRIQSCGEYKVNLKATI